ncbi:MAG TPA: hypothetical protein VFK02_28695, partial [Kofleriaceae bacterium]|nr:hypothetical protein [Kofleriaceae bacterium]
MKSITAARIRTTVTLTSLALGAASCGSPSSSRGGTSSSSPGGAAGTELPGKRGGEAGCDEPVVALEAGGERGVMCPADAAARKLTIVDLRDAWTPSLFAPDASGNAPSFRAKYLALAAEHDPSGAPITGEGALGELYGVLPSLAIVRERLADDARHFCHAFIEDDAIALLDKPYAQDHKDVVRLADQMRVMLEA